MDDCRERAYKIVVYSAISFSFIAIFSVCLTLPIVYNFIVHIQLQSKHDLNYCKV